VTFSEVNAEYDTSERRAIAAGGSGVEWRSVMIGKVCAIENKVQNIENEHAELGSRRVCYVFEFDDCCSVGLGQSVR
jgi:hypothetical protein